MPLGDARDAIEAVTETVLSLLAEEEDSKVRSVLAKVGRRGLNHYSNCFYGKPRWYERAEQIFAEIDQERSP